MVILTPDERMVLSQLLSWELPKLQYTHDNTVVFKESSNNSIYSSKFDYNPYPKFEDEEVILRAKARGLDDVINHPYLIQNRLKKAKRNDRFKQLPAVVFGIDNKNEVYFYVKGTGSRANKVVISSILRLPMRSYIKTELGNHYHVYSVFNRISNGSLSEKNYSLKVLAWLLSNENYRRLFPLFRLIMKGVMISNAITPDIIVTMTSSKKINKDVVNYLMEDEFFSKCTLIEISKPKTEEVLDEYCSGDYGNSDYFNKLVTRYNTCPESMEEIKMRRLTSSDRKLYSILVRAIMKKSSNNIRGKVVLFIDDVITTGGTMSRILIPMFEESNKVLPFSFLIR